jgi:hypothetical protein
MTHKRKVVHEMKEVGSGRFVVIRGPREEKRKTEASLRDQTDAT